MVWEVSSKIFQGRFKIAQRIARLEFLDSIHVQTRLEFTLNEPQKEVHFLLKHIPDQTSTSDKVLLSLDAQFFQEFWSTIDKIDHTQNNRSSSMIVNPE